MTLEGALTLFELYNLQGLAKSIPTMFAVFMFANSFYVNFHPQVDLLMQFKFY